MIVISGPSTVGKSRVISALKIKYGMEQVVSYTTRKKREDEIEGINYHFVNEDFFVEKKEEFLLWKKNDLGYYGTLEKDIYEPQKNGRISILDLDVEEALKIKNIFKDAILVFLLPDSLEEIKDRLLKRGPERGILCEADAMLRYYRSVEMLKRCYEFDYLILNNDEYETADYIHSIIVVESINKKRKGYLTKWCNIED